MWKQIAILYLCASLSACAALELLQDVLPGSKAGIAVDAQIGDKDQSVHVTSNEETNIAGAEEVIINNSDDFWIMMALIGWCAPSPGKMCRSAKQAILNLWRRRKNGK